MIKGKLIQGKRKRMPGNVGQHVRSQSAAKAYHRKRRGLVRESEGRREKLKHSQKKCPLSRVE